MVNYCCAGTADCNYTSGYHSAYGIALDPSSGALYVTITGTNAVCRVPADGGACELACATGVGVKVLHVLN
jgi:hypothetical protein